MTAMPTELSDDALKLLVARHGVRGACRVLQLDDTETERIRKRAQRAGWCQQFEAVMPSHAELCTTKPLVPRMSPALAELQEAAARVRSARFSAVRLSERKLLALERRDDDELLTPELISAAHQTTKDAALAGGWNADTRPDAPARSFGARDTGLVIDAEPIQEDDVQIVPHTSTGHEQIGESPK